MAKGRYVIPTVMGQLGREMYLVNGNLPKDQKVGLARYVNRRGVCAKDQEGIAKIPNIDRQDYQVPTMLTELVVIDHDSLRNRNHTASEAVTIEGFIRNTIPSSKNAAELDGWFLYEKNGDLTPLKIAKFSINLLDDSTKRHLIDQISGRGPSRW